jgi:hypothetical protein
LILLTMASLKQVLHNATRIAAVAATTLIVTFLLRADLHGYGASVFWAYHPTFMVLAFVLFMSLGTVGYVSDYGGVRCGLPADRRWCSDAWHACHARRWGCRKLVVLAWALPRPQHGAAGTTTSGAWQRGFGSCALRAPILASCAGHPRPARPVPCGSAALPPIASTPAR